MAAVTLLLVSSIVFAEVPDTNSYWKILVKVQKQARQHLNDAMSSCSNLSASEAEVSLKEWESSVQAARFPGSKFNPCSGSGTLVDGNIIIVASEGRALKLSGKGAFQSEWDFQARTVKLGFNGDLISLSINPISVSVLNVSLGSYGARKQPDSLSEKQIITGLESFWRSAHDRYPNHSMYDVALQVITEKDEGREMLLDFIRCGKSICE